MKNIYLNILLSVLFFAACNPSGQSNDTAAAKPQVTLRAFTDTTRLDTFRIVLNGDKPENMALVFTITPQGSKPVYTRVLKTKELIDNYKGSIDLSDSKGQIQFMKEELSVFFDDENFMEPAVMENEEPTENTPDKIFFAELKKTGLNGFKYRYGKENKVYIAWSVVEKKVKRYYECCR